jgi:hypothetical protein
MPSNTPTMSKCVSYGDELRANVKKFYDERLGPLETKLADEKDKLFTR